jgi:hypothetical protein
MFIHTAHEVCVCVCGGVCVYDVHMCICVCMYVFLYIICSASSYLQYNPPHVYTYNNITLQVDNYLRAAEGAGGTGVISNNDLVVLRGEGVVQVGI